MPWCYVCTLCECLSFLCRPDTLELFLNCSFGTCFWNRGVGVLTKPSKMYPHTDDSMILRTQSVIFRDKLPFVFLSGCFITGYGNCSTQCPSECQDRHCDAFDGKCIHGCQNDRMIVPDCTGKIYFVIQLESVYIWYLTRCRQISHH